MMFLNKSSKSKSSGFSYKILNYLLLLSTGGILTLSFLFISGIWRLGSHLTDTLEAFLTLTHPDPKIEHSTLIINQIRGISELTTAVFVMEAVVPTSGERKWGNLVIGKTELLYIAQGQVRAGIDLEALTPEQIKINHNHLSIQLPPVKILDSKIDINQSRVYDYDRGFLGLGPDIAPQLQTLAQQETLKKIVKTACTHGILEEANTKAQLAITQFLTTTGYEQVEVKTRAVDVKTCEQSTSN